MTKENQDDTICDLKVCAGVSSAVIGHIADFEMSNTQTASTETYFKKLCDYKLQDQRVTPVVMETIQKQHCRPFQLHAGTPGRLVTF